MSHDDAAGYLALPPAGLPAPRRQLLVGTALACVAGSTLIGGMLAIWVLLRERVVDRGERFPVDYIITEVASNVMLMTIFALCLFAQWAVYAGKRGDRAHAALALAIVAIMAILALGSIVAMNAVQVAHPGTVPTAVGAATEGTETRFGVSQSATFAAATTLTSRGRSTRSTTPTRPWAAV